MMQSVIRKSTAVLIVLSAVLFLQAQPAGKNENKPYSILTSGKQVTIKSTKEILGIMVWTADGHRIVEQKGINAASFTFSIGISGKVFFLLLELKGNKRYTEKIGMN
jgi:hypothetical protein